MTASDGASAAVGNPLRIPTVATLSSAAAGQYGDRPAQRDRQGDGWRTRDYRALHHEVERIGRGLLALGVERGDRVALLGETAAEWTWCDLAIAAVGAVCVPVYPTNSSAECAWVLGDSGATVVLCQTAGHLAKVEAIRPRLPQLRHVVPIDAIPDGAGVDPLAVSRRASGVLPTDLSTIVYTSGTTGPPKGCLLTHANWRASLDNLAPLVRHEPDDVVYVYLPLAHLLTRMVQLATLEQGAELAYFGGDLRRVVAELAEVRPTHLPSVPRLFEKIQGQIAALAAGREDELAEAVRVGLAHRRGATLDEADQVRFQVAEQRLFAPLRELLGGRVREAVTGGAPIAVELLSFFTACGIPLYEGFGMTESTAVISLNSPDANRPGTVGRPLPGTEVRIAPDGEVLTRGAHVFQGYHNDPEATAAAVDPDGWLHTGDLGRLDRDGYLSITGRKKDLIVTSGGKNLTPANLENELRRSPWISQAVMLGDRRPYAVALLTLDVEEIGPWARQRGLPQAPARLADRPEVRALLQQELDRANSGFAPAEQIRRFAILPRDLGIEEGELTPSLKVKRAVVAERYAHVVDALYGEDGRADS